MSITIIGKIFQTLGVLFLGPLILDILLPTFFKKPTDTILVAIDAWAKTKSDYLYQLSLPIKFVTTFQQSLSNHSSRIEKYSSKIFDVSLFCLMTVIPLSILTAINPQNLDNLFWFFLVITIDAITKTFSVKSDVLTLKRMFFLDPKEWILAKIQEKQRYFRNTMIYFLVPVTLGTLIFILFFYSTKVTEKLNLFLFNAFLVSAFVFLVAGSLPVVLNINLESDSSTRASRILNSRIKTFFFSVLNLLVIIGVFFCIYLLSPLISDAQSEPLPTLFSRISISIMFAAIFVPLVIIFVPFFREILFYDTAWLFFDETSPGLSQTLVFIISLYLNQILFSVIIVSLLLVSFALQIVVIFPTRYVLRVIATKTTKWLFALFGGLFELMGIWLS